MPACDKFDVAGCDLEERDINGLNKHIKLQFEDIFGEQPGPARSLDCVWKGSYCCFNGTLNCCYNCMTIFCAIPIACCWACQFACLACYHVWCITPQITYWVMWCQPVKTLFQLYLSVFLAPLFEVCGYCFSKIVVTSRTDSDKMVQQLR